MTIRFDQPAPARKLGYALLWLFAQRVEKGEDFILQHELPDWDLTLRAATRETAANSNNDDYSYADLLNDCKEEINYLINGASFPRTSLERPALAIESPAILEVIANALGNFDGVIGFALAGNANCPTTLLKELESSTFTYMGHSTRDRAQQTLRSR